MVAALMRWLHAEVELHSWGGRADCTVRYERGGNNYFATAAGLPRSLH